MALSSITEHWIRQDALTITLNVLGPDIIQASVLSGTAIAAYKNGVIGYDTGHNFRTWPVLAYATALEYTGPNYVYAKLTRSEKSPKALISYSKDEIDIEGRRTLEDGSYSEIDAEYFYIYLGKISASVDESGNQVDRYWIDSFRFGTLGTNQFQMEIADAEWKQMFRLNKVSDVIEVLKDIASATIGKLKVLSEFIFAGKTITDIATSQDDYKTVEKSDSLLATPGYVETYSEETRVSKLHDDIVHGNITFRKNVTIEGESNVKGNSTVEGRSHVGGNIDIDGNADIQGNTSIGGDATINGKVDIKDKITIGDFIEEGDIIQGAKVTKEGVGSFAGLKSPFMQIYELIYNRKTAVQGEFAFSDGDTVEDVTLNEDGSYTLSLREQYKGYTTTFKKDDIVYANINIIGESGEAATTGKCWMRVNSEDNKLSLTVLLYSDDQVPSKKNILPQPHMMITRHGNETDKTRQDVWIISSEDGRMYQLTGVNSPTIDSATAYATVWGKLPQNLVEYIQQHVTNFNPNQPYLYARGAVIQDLILFNYKGEIIKTENYRGAWSYKTAINDPYVTTETTYDTVTHNGSKWMVQANGTIVEPSETVTEWTIVTAKGETGVSYSLKPSPSTVQVFKNQTKSVLSLDVTVVESGEDIIELTEQDELDERGLKVQFALDGQGERYDLEIGGVYAIEDENGEAVFVDEAYEGEDDILYFEGEAIDLSQVQDNITIYLVKNGKDIAEQRVPVVKDGKDGEQGIQGIQGETGRSSFTSIVFLRSNPTPSTPQGGSYDSPIPTGWSDGIPDDSEERIWMSTRIFSSDGMPPQTEEWTKPEVVSSTADMQIIFSSKETPQPPSGDYDETDVDWAEESSSETIWMAIRKNKDGIWSAWKTSKIKGEKGDDGTSIKVKGSLDDESQLPIPPADSSDCYIIGTDLYVWDGTTWKNVGKFAGKDGTSSTRLDLDNQNDSMLYDSDGNLLSGSITSKVTLYVGNEKIQDAQFGISNKNVEAELVDDVITVTACNAASGTVNVTCIYDGTVYTSIMSIKRIVNGARYEIVTNPTSVTYNETKDELSHNTVFIEIYRSAQDTTGKFVREKLSTLPTGHLVAVLPSTGGSITVDYNSGATVAVDKSWEYFTVLLVDDYENDYENARLDEETVPVIRVKDGDNGENGHSYSLQASINTVSSLVDATSGLIMKTEAFSIDFTYCIDNEPYTLTTSDLLSLDGFGEDIPARALGVSEGKARLFLSIKGGVTPETKNITVTVTPLGLPTATTSISVSHPQRGLVGPAGDTGVMLYPAGYWDANTVYTQVKDEEGKAVATPFVYYQNKQGAGDYYVLQQDLPNAGIDPSTDDSETYWKKFQPIQYLFTEALMANWARLAKSVFWGDYMFSTKGVNQAGEVVDHTAYMGTDNPMFDSETNRLTGALIPNLFLDLENGMVKTNKLSETFRPFRESYTITDNEGLKQTTAATSDILSLETSYNVKCESGLKLLMMPLLTSITDENGTVRIAADSVPVDGVHSVVSVIPNVVYESNISSALIEIGGSNKTPTSLTYAGAIGHCVILCADPRIFAYQSYKKTWKNQHRGERAFFAPSGTKYTGATYVQNEIDMFFSVGGTLTKWLILEPGAIANLRLIKTDKEHIWMVENAADYEQLDISINIGFALSDDDVDFSHAWVTGGVIGYGNNNTYDTQVDLGVTRLERVYGSKRLRSLCDKRENDVYIPVIVSSNNYADKTNSTEIADNIEPITYL